MEDATNQPTPSAPPRRTKIEVQVENAKRRAKALELRIAGATWQQVAEGAGYSDRGAAHRACMQEVREIPEEKAEELRAIEIGALMRVRAAYWKPMRAGDHAAANVVLGTHDRLVKLLGLETVQQDDGSLAVQEALTGFVTLINSVDLGDNSLDGTPGAE
jgi:hypothetical protein